MTKLTGITWTDGTTYLFRGDEYVAVDPSGGSETGPSKPIAASWPGVFESDIDAVVVWPNAKAYFFRGGEYVRYDIATDAVDDGYPQPIAGAWKGVFEDGVDAAVVWPNGKAYFLRGGEYVRYDVGTDAVDDGYPKPVSEGWPDVLASGIDAIILGSDGRKAFIVGGDEYLSYDVATDAVDDGYPQPVAGSWLDAFASSDGGVQPLDDEETRPPIEDDGTEPGDDKEGTFTFEVRAGESIRDRIVRCCEEALSDGPLGQTERHDVYREFISCGQEKTPDAAERLTGVKTSCAMFVRAVRHWCGAAPQGPYKPGTGMFTSMGGVSFGHASFVKNDGSNVPQPGDYFYISSSQSSNDGHTGIFIEELSPGTWRTAEGGGGDGTLCRFAERTIAGNRFGNDARTLWGWFDCTLVGLPE
ncbi:MAG: hemopexin repeat-containing protein [Actinomycetota bacterium]